jgi:hypothetical protein
LAFLQFVKRIERKDWPLISISGQLSNDCCIAIRICLAG